MQDNASQYAAQVLSARQARAFQLSEQKREALYKAYPLLKPLQLALAEAGAQAAKQVLSGVNPRECEASVEAAENKLKKYIKENKIDTNTDFYFCDDCRDTGYLSDGCECKCLRQLKTKYAAERINADSPLSLCSFDSFSLDYYSREKKDGSRLSSRDIMEKNLQACRDFAKSSPRTSKGLLLLGGAGLGKTHLALSIASVMLGDGYNVVYCSAANIFKQIETEYFTQKNRETLDSLKYCDMLILDDLGAEYVTPFVVNTLYDIVNTRINEKRPSVYTTNITDISRLEMRYGEAVSSRLRGCCSLLPFVGEDIRLQKAAQGL